VFALAFASEEKDEPFLARAYYAEAVSMQPKNPETLLLAGLFELSHGCPRHAYAYLEPFTELDPQERQDRGGDAYRRARDLVNTGKPTC
jgi:Tfp pilus assembly protein PilF